MPDPTTPVGDETAATKASLGTSTTVHRDPLRDPRGDNSAQLDAGPVQDQQQPKSLTGKHMLCMPCTM